MHTPKKIPQSKLKRFYPTDSGPSMESKVSSRDCLFASIRNLLKYRVNRLINLGSELVTGQDQINTSLFKKVSRICLKLLIFFFISSVVLTLFYRFVPVPYTPLMFWRSTASIFSNEKFIGIEKKWVSIEEIAKSMQTSVINAEDYKFYQHNGFDFEAIEKAIQYNKSHKKQKGASTISQQTAKNVFLWPTRSWIRKGLEAYFTVLIETLWSKERILEVYLNVIELGKGVYGVEAAAQKFFKKPAKKLTLAQSALMAAVLPNPIKFKIDKPSSYISRRQRKIMGRRAPSIIADVGPKEKVEEAPNELEKTRTFLELKFDDDVDESDNESEVTKKEGAPAPSEIPEREMIE